MPTLTTIRLFVAAYEERSFSRAASREHTTQPAVSQRVRALEEELGVQLFERSPARVAPTSAASAYYRRAIEFLRSLEEAGREARDAAGELSGAVRAGLMPSLTRCCLGPVLASFAEQHAQVEVQVTEAWSGVLTELLRAGELDFAIVPAFDPPVGIRSRHLARTPELLVSRRGARFGHLRPVAAAELRDLRLLVPAPLNTRRQRIETWLSANGATVTRRLEIDSMYGTLDLVARSDWLAILPGVMLLPELAQRGEHALDVHPLVQPLFTLDLVVIEAARCPPPPAAAAFLAALSAELARAGARMPGTAGGAPPVASAAATAG